MMNLLNIELYIFFFFLRKMKEQSPKIMFIRVIENCNANCFMCNYARETNGKELTELEFNNLIKEMKKSEYQLIKFTGGEPLLHKGLKNFIKISKINGYKTSIITNGYLLKNKYKDLIDSGLDHITISLDSNKPEVHDKIRGKGNFRKTVAIAKYISKTYGKETLSVGLTVTNNNINDIEKIIDFANEELHAGQIKVVRYTPVVEGTKEYDITDNKKRLELCKMLVRKRDELMKDETYLKFNRLMSFIGGIRNDASEFCAAGRLRLCILPNGIVCPCPILSSHDVKMGDLRKQTLDEIWNGQELKDFRKLSKRNDSKCKECQYFSSCGGGCKANALPYGGSFTTRDTWCYKEIEDEIKDDAIICKNVN